MKQDYHQIRMLEVAPQVYAAGQLFETDLKLLAAQGTRGIINTRPDGESTGQPLSADLAKVAGELGIAFVHIPVEPGPLSSQVAKEFAKACQGLERPLVVFSHAGAHSTRIWETAEAAHPLLFS
jgi:sulfide:quinone oxidoreductase